MWASATQTDKHLPQSPFTGHFFKMTTFFIAFYESYLSTQQTYVFVEIGRSVLICCLQYDGEINSRRGRLF
jgi:hypothetical protein